MVEALAVGGDFLGAFGGFLFFARVLFLAFLLELVEFGHVLFQLIAEAALLEMQVAELFFVGERDFGGDEGGAASGVGFFGEGVGKFEATEGEDTGFERSDAEDAPLGVGDELDEGFFRLIGRTVEIKVVGETPFVGSRVVGGEEWGLAGEAGFKRVHGRFGFSFWTGGSGTELGVGAVGGETRGGDDDSFTGGFEDLALSGATERTGGEHAGVLRVKS